MFDYIIVGAGAAGCALANRLSENPDKEVLLVEAGKADKKREIHIPAAFTRLFKTEYDWNYQSIPQPYAGDREMYLPRGKVLGGSTSMNAMIYIRGHRVDFDQWAALGNRGWDYDSVLPYFLRSEGNSSANGAYHSQEGEVHVSDLSEPFSVSEAFVRAGAELGYPTNPDFNGNRQEGFGLYQVTQKHGRRFSAARAFLEDAEKRPNLTILKQAQVLRVLIENSRAVGVEVKIPTHIQEYRASEVILSAGAYNSPQLLMLSGVGDPDHLQEMGIGVKHALAGVGQNLQDHLIVPMVFQNRDHHTLEEAESLKSFTHYLFWGEGPLSSNIAEAGGFIKTSNDLPAPDIQYHFAPGFFLNHGLNRPEQGHGFSLGPTLLQPESIGQVRLQSKNPYQAPAIDHNYLSEEKDVETLINGMRIGYELLKTRALGRYFKDYHLPNRKLVQPGELERHIRHHSQTLYHPVGTCKMGQDDMAVVDEQLRVRGIEGLRVADASIMPRVIRGNTQAASIMIGEKAADMILHPKTKRPSPQKGRLQAS